MSLTVTAPYLCFCCRKQYVHKEENGRFLSKDLGKTYLFTSMQEERHTQPRTRKQLHISLLVWAQAFAVCSSLDLSPLPVQIDWKQWQCRITGTPRLISYTHNYMNYLVWVFCLLRTIPVVSPWKPVMSICRECYRVVVVFFLAH